MHVTGPSTQAWSAADEERALAILGQLMLNEVQATATAEQRWSWLAAIGRRLAALIALPDQADMEGLAERANRLWTSLNMGSAVFTLCEDGIAIVQSGLPVNDGDQLHDWETVLPPLLEGAYTQWFETIGGVSDKLCTRVTASGKGLVELRHGF